MTNQDSDARRRASSANSICVLDTYGYHMKQYFGLEVRSDRAFPLVIGCSLRREGHVFDLPAQRVLSAGLVLWPLDPSEAEGFPFSGPHVDAAASVIFALWSGSDFKERLADTGWVPAEFLWLVGSSAAGLYAQDEEIQGKYGLRRGALQPLDPG
jgi:hypothetical protein